ncbi:hypothetical protein Aperf_G00000099003 [Anoplocephala perfoliata]
MASRFSECRRQRRKLCEALKVKQAAGSHLVRRIPIGKSRGRENKNTAGEEGSFCSSRDTQLPPPVKDILSLKYTVSGWTTEAIQELSPGDWLFSLLKCISMRNVFPTHTFFTILCDVLFVEKPWAISLLNEPTKYCYFCCKRRSSLTPCNRCHYVGFCNESCATNASKLEKPGSRKGNVHIYDCHGLLPSNKLHVAFNCIAQLSSETLLDYLCSTGPYEGGMGHQAFIDAERIRSVGPVKLVSSDYSSVAWLHAGYNQTSYSKPSSSLIASM